MKLVKKLKSKQVSLAATMRRHVTLGDDRCERSEEDRSKDKDLNFPRISPVVKIPMKKKSLHEVFISAREYYKSVYRKNLL